MEQHALTMLTNDWVIDSGAHHFFNRREWYSIYTPVTSRIIPPKQSNNVEALFKDSLIWSQEPIHTPAIGEELNISGFD